MEETSKMKEKVISALQIGGFLLLIGLAFYHTVIRTTNEIGYLGVDKAGRQILIQTMDANMQPDIRVDSDFHDYNFLSRMLIQEPMRTTIRFDIQNQDKIQLQSIEDFLALPYDDFLNEYQGMVSIRSDSEVTPEELDKRLKEKDAKTMEDFLAGFGFKKFQIYQQGKHAVTVEIKGVKNVQWAGE